MAIALITQNGQSGVSVTASQSYTVDSGSTGSNRLMVVGWWNVSTVTLSSATYAGSSMTAIVGFTAESSRAGGLIYIVNPATGSNTLTLNFSGSLGGDNRMCCAVISGAKQTAQPDSSSALSAQTGTSVTLATTVVANNSWAFMHSRNGTGGDTDGTATTLVVDDTNDTTSPSTSSIAMHRSTNPLAAGSQTLTASFGGSSTWGGAIASFSPAVTAVTGSMFFGTDN